jgi:hypothetical protein
MNHNEKKKKLTDFVILLRSVLVAVRRAIAGADTTLSLCHSPTASLHVSSNVTGSMACEHA